MEMIEHLRTYLPRRDGWSLDMGAIGGYRILLHCSLLLVLFPPFGFLYAILFPAILVHELAHAIVNNRVGFGKGKVYFFGLGGAFMPDNLPAHPFLLDASQRRRFAAVIVAGPLSSLLLSAISIALAYIPGFTWLAGWGSLNFMIAIFNLLPFPFLDGGQLVTLAGLSLGKRQTFSMIAAISLTIIFGLFAVLGFLPFSSFGTVFILLSTVQAWIFAFTKDEQIRFLSLEIREYIVEGRAVEVEAGTPLRDLVADTQSHLWLIRDQRKTRTIDRPFLLRTLKRRGMSSTAGDIARPLYAEIRPDETIAILLQRMEQCHLPEIPVIQDGQLIGSIGYEEIKKLDPKIARRLESDVHPFPDKL